MGRRSHNQRGFTDSKTGLNFYRSVIGKLEAGAFGAGFGVPDADLAVADEEELKFGYFGGVGGT
jgi:hypothetical protein